MHLAELLKDSAYRFAVLPIKDNAVFIEQSDVPINGTGVATIGRAAPYLHKQRALVDQHYKGSSGQIELYPADIANFYCPEVDKSTQKKIDALAQGSIELKAKSERHLEAAKRAVEIAIEQDEAAGIAHLAHFGALT